MRRSNQRSRLIHVTVSAADETEMANSKRIQTVTSTYTLANMPRLMGEDGARDTRCRTSCPNPRIGGGRVELVRFIAGPVAEMEPKTIQALETFHRILRLPPLALTAPTKDPVKTSTAAVRTSRPGGDRRRSPCRLSGP
jgi:hypothetical protein